jgi:hypothetical protein
MTDSIYILSTRSNSYIGYYSGNVTSLLRHEWEGMDVEVELYYKHTKAKEMVSMLRSHFKRLGQIRDNGEKDAYGFWVKKLTRKDIDSVLLNIEYEQKEQPKIIYLGSYFF